MAENYSNDLSIIYNDTKEYYVYDVLKFDDLRSKIAHIYSKELGDFFDKQFTSPRVSDLKEYNAFWNKYNEDIVRIQKELNVDEGIIDFLFLDDSFGYVNNCTELYKLIKDADIEFDFSDDNYIKNCNFKNIQHLIKGCYERNSKLRWYRILTGRQYYDCDKINDLIRKYNLDIEKTAAEYGISKEKLISIRNKADIHIDADTLIRLAKALNIDDIDNILKFI